MKKHYSKTSTPIKGSKKKSDQVAESDTASTPPKKAPAAKKAKNNAGHNKRKSKETVVEFDEDSADEPEKHSAPIKTATPKKTTPKKASPKKATPKKIACDPPPPCQKRFVACLPNLGELDPGNTHPIALDTSRPHGKFQQ